MDNVWRRKNMKTIKILSKKKAGGLYKDLIQYTKKKNAPGLYFFKLKQKSSALVGAGLHFNGGLV